MGIFKFELVKNFNFESLGDSGASGADREPTATVCIRCTCK